MLVCVLGTLGVVANPLATAAGVASKRPDSDGGNLTVAIDGPGPTADAGVPFTLSASLGDAIGPFEYIWNCPALGTTHTAEWTVRLATLGPEPFSLEVGDAAGEVGWTNLTVNITDDPLLSAVPVNRSADAGVPLGVALTVREGVAPYRLFVAVNGRPGDGPINLSANGTVVDPVWTNATGPVWVTANVTDAVGGTDTASAWVAQAAAVSTLALALSPPTGEVGVPVHLTAAVAGGTPPIAWTVGALGALTNATPTDGVLEGTGTVSWNATPTATGALAVWMTTVDALGVVRSANATVVVVAPVNATLEVANRSLLAGAEVNLSALVGGGIPPYTLAWSASDGVRGSGAVGVPGPVNWSVPAIAAGFLTVELTVHDAAGGSFSATATVFAFPASSPPAPVAGDPSDASDGPLIVVGLCGALGVGAWWWRRRRPSRGAGDPARTAYADQVIGDTIRSRDGIDDDSLHASGDAQMLERGEVFAAAQRLTAAGRVRAEREGDITYFHAVAPPDPPAPTPSDPPRPKGSP